MLARGITAPDFELYATPDQRLRLSELKGKRVILAFYPADWSPVCGSQMNLYNEMEKYFTRHNAQLIGISVDSKWCHSAFSGQNHFYFPLLADFEPKGAVARAYEAYDETVGECRRALYVLDEDGIIRWRYLSPVGINPGANGILNALEELDSVKTIMNQLTPPANANDHTFGNPDAPIELVEYGDYQCPSCGHANEIIKAIQLSLPRELKFVFRNFPLSSIHPHAFSAAVASEAAGKQNKFWEMHDIIFVNQKILDGENIFHFAKNIGLDLDRFKHDIQQKPLIEKVATDFESGIRSGVNKTPTFFINGEKYDGDWTGDQLFHYLEDLLKGASILSE